MIAAPAATGWYLYGVVGAADERVRRSVEQLHGVGGAGGLVLVGGGSLAAVAGPVSLHEFGEEALRERLNDRDWLERAALAHEEVLERVAEAAAVVPLRFGSVHLRLDDVEALLDARGPAFAAALARVTGRVELGVKAWLEPRRAGAAPASSGRAYLEQLRDARRRAAAESRELAATLASAHARLLERAEEGVVNPPQPRELTGREDEMVLNAAYLVGARDEALILEVAELDDRHRRDGLRFEVTGPWPPYNFVDQGAFA